MMKFIFSIIFAILFCVPTFGQKSDDDRRSNRPVEPFRIIGNVYYVGASEVTSFLIVTPKGHILVDAGFPETASQIIKNIRTIGFKPEDIKLMLNTQAHFDHAGGFAEIKRLSGAKMIASPLDKVLIEAGGKNDFTWEDTLDFEPVKVDRVVKDREKVSLGGATLTAIFTPGHTKGCTAWEYSVTEKGRKYKVLFWGSASSPGYKFYGNKNYPNIVAEYEKTFAVMKTLKPDVFLASHGSFFDLLEKAEKIRTTREPNPFVDSKAFGEYAIEAEKAHRAKLAEQKKAANEKRTEDETACLDALATARNISVESGKNRAVEEYTSIIQNGCSNVPAARMSLGLALADLGRFEEAADQYRKIIERDPEHWAAHWTLAQTLILEIGNFVEGEKEVEISRKLDDLGSIGFIYDYYFGRAYAGMGDNAKALRHFEIYINRQSKINPNDEKLKEAKEQVKKLK